MALAQVFEFSESQDGTIIYLNDETGEYDADEQLFHKSDSDFDFAWHVTCWKPAP